MKKLLAIFAVLSATPVFAQEVKTYRPFRYETPCVLEYQDKTFPGTCVVIETREKGGALRSRNIFSNTHKLTIKGLMDKEKGYMTWDSHNKYEYQWQYKPGNTQNLSEWTYVMPGFLLQNLSWD